MTQHQMLDIVGDVGLRRDERTLRRWREALREAGFDIFRRGDGRYELRGSPVRLSFTGYEALATLSLLDSLAARDPVYGQHLASAAAKLREALPGDALKFADAGGIEFAVDSASDPPEDPRIMDTLRRATHQLRRVSILYHSLRSGTTRRRLVEPVRVYYAQRAHRLDAYEPEEGRISEFRINRIREADLLPDRFAPEAHRHSFTLVEVRLSPKAFTALGRTVVPDASAMVELAGDGGAIVTGATPNAFWTVRDLASLGPEAEVLGGEDFKEQFVTFLRQTSQKYF